MNGFEYTVTYLIDVLQYELNIRGYRKIKIKRKKNTLEVNADGLKAYVYNLDIVNPFSNEVEEIVMSVIRQLSLKEIDRGDKM